MLKEQIKYGQTSLHCRPHKVQYYILFHVCKSALFHRQNVCKRVQKYMIKYTQIITNRVQNLTSRAYRLSLFDKFHCWVNSVKCCKTISCPQTSFWKKKWLYINYYNVTNNKRFVTPTVFCQCSRGYTECFLAQLNQCLSFKKCVWLFRSVRNMA